MEDVRAAVAANIARLRTAQGLTQTSLAEKLNYSDKAVSKWERGESVPDIAVLVQLADLFGVSLDELVGRAAPASAPSAAARSRHVRIHIPVTCLSVLLVWLIATVVFVPLQLSGVPHSWLPFLYAVPVSSIVWLVFNCIWFDPPRRNFLIVSILMWSLLAAVYLTLLVCGGFNLWLLFLLGVPGQTIILVWSRIFVK